MAGILDHKFSGIPAILNNTYAGCFQAFLTKVEQRLHILGLPLADILKEYVPPKKGDKLTRKFSNDDSMNGGASSKKTKKKVTKTKENKATPGTDIPAVTPDPKYSKSVVTFLAKRLPAVKYLLAKLRPDIKFQITRVRDLYKYISGEYTVHIEL